jgi:protein PhnA
MLNYKHWSCLTEAMWSEVPAIQVISWRMLNRLREESWAAENLDRMFLDDDTLVWAKATGDHFCGAIPAGASSGNASLTRGIKADARGGAQQQLCAGF